MVGRYLEKMERFLRSLIFLRARVLFQASYHQMNLFARKKNLPYHSCGNGITILTTICGRFRSEKVTYDYSPAELILHSYWHEIPLHKEPLVLCVAAVLQWMFPG